MKSTSLTKHSFILRPTFSLKTMKLKYFYFEFRFSRFYSLKKISIYLFKNEADRTLIYITLYISDCLRTLLKVNQLVSGIKLIKSSF